MKNMINKLAVKDIMQTAPLTVSKATLAYDALTLMAQHGVCFAVIVGADNEVKGVVSDQDLLRGLWSQEFTDSPEMRVEDMMQTEILSISLQDKVEALIEFMVVDKEKLFPVNGAGALLSQSYQSYQTRLRLASSNKPRCYPVVEHGKLQGLVTREELTSMLSHYHNHVLQARGDLSTMEHANQSVA